MDAASWSFKVGGYITQILHHVKVKVKIDGIQIKSLNTSIVKVEY